MIEIRKSSNSFLNKCSSHTPNNTNNHKAPRCILLRRMQSSSTPKAKASSPNNARTYRATS